MEYVCLLAHSFANAVDRFCPGLTIVAVHIALLVCRLLIARSCFCHPSSLTGDPAGPLHLPHVSSDLTSLSFSPSLFSNTSAERTDYTPTAPLPTAVRSLISPLKKENAREQSTCSLPGSLSAFTGARPLDPLSRWREVGKGKGGTSDIFQTCPSVRFRGDGLLF